MVVRCSMARSMRIFISKNAAAARRTSRAPRGRKFGASRPLPNASAASASRTIGLIWLRRNTMAMVSTTTEVSTIHIRKISELEL